MFEPSKLFEVIGEPLPIGRLKKEGDGGTTWADPFSLESLIAWLETKDPAARYDYGCNGHCLIAQYLPAVGIPCLGVIPGGYRVTEERTYLPHPSVFDDIAYGDDDRPAWTFGAALTRAQAAIERLS